MGADVLKKFGRYFLLDQLAQGGMAEIYRARLAAADGAGRLLVIKRIQAGYGANSEFLQMFKSEIKVTMGFNHPNIVQLYDFGEEQEQPYIAMELVDGKNLRQFGSRFNELKQPFPVELAAYIIEQAACGLHYAHSFKDKISGQALNIVHRDISPQNILISFEGHVKVIDFGIAKATTNSESTRAGVIKGKPSYLSPEQISGEPLDGRCDIFALGIVLWELLAGKKLFAGENDLAVLKLIESANTHVKPPSTLNPKVPKELDYIVLKTLAKQREKRYQTAEELQRALHKFLYTFQPEFNPQDLAYYAKDLFKSEIVEDRKKIQRLNDKVEQLLLQDIPDVSLPEITASKGAKREDTTTIVEPRSRSSSGARETVVNLSSLNNAKIEMESAPPPKVSTASRPAIATSSSTASRSIPRQAQAPQQAKSTKKSPLQLAIGAAAAVLAIAFLGPDYGITVPVLSEMLGAGSSEARIVLQGDQTDVTVQVNGQTVANALPVTQKIASGTPVRVTVTAANGASFQQELTLQKGEKRVLAVTLSQENRTTASLQGSGQGSGTEPSSGGDASAVIPGKTVLVRFNIQPCGGAQSFYLNGKPLDPNAPSAIVTLDAPVEVIADRMGFKPYKSEFVIDSRTFGGKSEVVHDVLLEPIRFGLLSIKSTPSADANIQMPDGKVCVLKTPVETEKFPIGSYTIRLTNELLGMEKTVNFTLSDKHNLVINEQLQVKN